MFENELKFMLEKEEYSDAISILDNNFTKKCFTHTNYYYDTQDHDFYKNNILFRVRVTDDGNMALQIKLPIKRDGPLRVKKEYVKPIDKLPAYFDLEDMEFSKMFNHTGLVKVVGMLITERRLYKANEGIHISLDKNKYLGKEDYELEIEYEENCREEALNLVNGMLSGYTSKPSQAGKRNRFYLVDNETQSIKIT